jgi:hypothetical protein
MKTQNGIKLTSYNDLEEALSLCASLNETINKYSHIEGIIPKSLTETINDFSEKVQKQLDELD